MITNPQTRTGVWMAILASGAGLMGEQLILPALPILQQDLGLSDSQIGWVTGAYFFPSILLAFPAGLLADRFGRRPVYVLSLGIFGLCGLALALSSSFTTIVLLRMVQGAAFSAIHPLSITMIGDAHKGIEQVRAQGFRYIVLAGADAAYPILGGLMVLAGWFLPFGCQVLALPLALVGWFRIPQKKGSSGTPAGYWRELAGTLRVPTTLALQASGFLRFVFKYGIMAYLPILLVGKRGMSPALVGLALGGSAAVGSAVVAFSARLARVIPPSRIMGLSLLVISVSFVVIAVESSAPITLLMVMAFGAADGSYGVFQNALVSQTPPPELRSAFIAATASIRNCGKFLAPLLMGTSVLFFTLEQSFILVGLIAIAALPTVPVLARLDHLLRAEETVVQPGEQAIDD